MSQVAAPLAQRAATMVLLEVRLGLCTHQREHLPELGAAEGAGAVVVKLVVQVELDRLLALEPTTL